MKNSDSPSTAATSPSKLPINSLLVQTAFVGDLLLSIPLLKQMRARNPDGLISLVCRKGLGDFLLSAGLVDDVFEIEKGSENDQASWDRALKALKPRQFDVIFCPHESFRSAMFVGRLKAKRKIGYKRFFNLFLFTDRVTRPMELPEAMRQLALLTPLDPSWSERLRGYAENTQKQSGGLLERESDPQALDPIPRLAPVPEWADMSIPRLIRLKENFRRDRSVVSASSERVRELVKKFDIANKKKPIAILAPGSVWATKMWTLDGYTKVARDLIKQGWYVIVLGAKVERETCRELTRRSPGAITIAGETNLYESTEFIAIADLVVCNDSGAMHMAAAAATPSVAIFGPTVLSFGYRPWQEQARVVEVDLRCRPCGKHGSQTCPLGTHACMRKITPEKVLEAVGAVTRPSNPEH